MGNRDLDPRGMDQGALYSFLGDVKGNVNTVSDVMHDLLAKLDKMSAVRSAGDTGYVSAFSGSLPSDLALTSLDPEG